jgi:hypothetical protein
MRRLSHFRDVHLYLVLIPIFFISCSSTAKKNLECTYSYGGLVDSMIVAPVINPYTVEDMKITVQSAESGKSVNDKTRFLFKVVYIEPPAENAAINIYVYRPSDEGPILIHQLKYLPPFPPRDTSQPYGFTGLQNVYEPSLGRTFQYWCRWK